MKDSAETIATIVSIFLTLISIDEISLSVHEQIQQRLRRKIVEDSCIQDSITDLSSEYNEQVQVNNLLSDLDYRDLMNREADALIRHRQLEQEGLFSPDNHKPLLIYPENNTSAISEENRYQLDDELNKIFQGL